MHTANNTKTCLRRVGKRKREWRAIAAIILVLSTFFTYVAYTVNNEKTAIENLSFTLTSVTIASIEVDFFHFDITGSINASFLFFNPTSYDTPAFTTDFKWYISATTAKEDGQYCGTGTLNLTKISAGNTNNSTTTLTFSLQSISISLLKAIQSQQIYIILEGTVSTWIFFNVVPVSQAFQISKSLSAFLP